MGVSIGRILIIPKDEWNDIDTYKKLDLVRHNGASWICKNSCTGIEPLDENSENWFLIAKDGEGISSIVDMVGATADTDGARGYVPAPKSGDEKKALLGDGTWGDVAIDVDDKLSDTSENPVQNKVISAKFNDVASKAHTHDNKSVLDGITSDKVTAWDTVNNKVNKEDGKGLSTNDYTTTEKNKLAGIATGANKTVVDSALSSSSTNPVQNKVITASISDTKNSKVTFTSNDTLAPTELQDMPSVLASKETHASLFSKISTVFKNMRYIIGLLGSTDISQETLGIGDSTVTGVVTALHENLSNLNNNFTNFSKTIKLKIYTELSDIGLSPSNLIKTSDDVATVVNAMPDKSIFVYLFSGGQYGLKSNGVGVIEIIKHNINRVTLKAIDNNSKTFYYGTYHGTSGFSGWYAVTGTLLS